MAIYCIGIVPALRPFFFLTYVLLFYSIHAARRLPLDIYDFQNCGQESCNWLQSRESVG